MMSGRRQKCIVEEICAHVNFDAVQMRVQINREKSKSRILSMVAMMAVRMSVEEEA